MLHVSTLRQDQHDASCTWIFPTSNWWLHIRNFTGCTWMQIVVHTTCCNADVSSSTLLVHLLAPCSQAIFSNKYSPASTNRTPRRIYNRSIYHQAPTAPLHQILTGNHFYNSLPKPLLRCHSVVKLFRSSPQIPIRFVFFAAFLGHGLLAVFWCFCEALAVA